MKIRQPAVAGRFYPADKKSTDDLIQQLVTLEKAKINYEYSKHQIVGAVLPHAGYIYSGATAVHFFEILRQSGQTPDTFVIINPNHGGRGAETALDVHDAWAVSNGTTEIDTELALETGFEYSEEAHKYEHSAEVMLPMLNYFVSGKFKILPVTMSRQTFENAGIIAEKITDASRKLGRKIVFLSSTDFSHYVEPEFGRILDSEIIEKICNFESEKMIVTVKQKRVSMCGYGPAAALMEYAKLNFPKPEAQLLRFGNSGEKSNSKEVVDYASILFYQKNKTETN
jgi:AmmeMemoRadiSam system protein B